jgi:hypothetical protein
MSFYFLTEFFRYFIRVLHEASGSWLKFVHVSKHPVYTGVPELRKSSITCLLLKILTFTFF